MTKNFFFGVRTPWTLANEEVWLRTNRLAGKILMAIGGSLIVFGVAHWPFKVLQCIIIGPALFPVVYSYFLYRKLEGPRQPPAPEPHENHAP